MMDTGADIVEVLPDDDDLGEQALRALRPNEGKWKNFDQMTPAERSHFAQLGVEKRRQRRLARQLADAEAYRQAHRERAAQVLGTNLAIYDSIVQKALGEDGVFHHDRLLKGELEMLVTLGKQLEERGHGKVAQKNETTLAVNVMHVVAELRRGLTSG